MKYLCITSNYNSVVYIISILCVMHRHVTPMSILTGRTTTQFLHIHNFVLLLRNRKIFAVEMPHSVSALHSKFQLRGFNFQKLAYFFIFLIFLSRYESYHKVEMGYLIALKSGTQKGSIRVHQAWLECNKHLQSYLHLFTKNNTNVLSCP